jgi:hypothetical protein
MIDISTLSTPSMLGIALAVCFLVLLIFSAAHHRRVKQYLLNELPTDDVTRREAAKFLGLSRSRGRS